MSRLQKKKPAPDKKRRVKADNQDAPVAGRESASGAAAPAAVPRVKPEKARGDAGVENVFTRAAEFIREVKVELKKVVWPTRKQTTGTTVVVILFVFIVAAFLGLFDFGLSKLVQVVLT